MLSWFYNGGFFGNSNWCVTNGCFTRTGTASACAPSARRLCWAAWVVRIPSKPGTLSPCGAERKAESRTCATSSTEYFTFKNENSGIQKNIRLLVLQRQSRLKKALLRFFLNAVPSVPRTASERTSVCALRLKTQCLKPVAASRRRDDWGFITKPSKRRSQGFKRERALTRRIYTPAKTSGERAQRSKIHQKNFIFIKIF